MGDENPNSEKNQQGCPFDDLIFQEILRRLPIKSILRFKSVSKQWYSILSSSKFAINTLFIKSGKNYYLFSYNDDLICANFEDNLFKLDPEFGFETDDLELTGSCNGLVCLTPTSGKYFILWNPATRKMQKYEPDTKPSMQYTLLLSFDEKIDIARYVPSLVSPVPLELPFEKLSMA